MTVIDTSQSTTNFLSTLKQHAVTAVGRFYSRRAWKSLTLSEAHALSGASIDLYVVFEDGGDPALTVAAGLADAANALQRAAAMTQPEGSAIYFALEHLPGGYEAVHVPGVTQYVTGVRQGLQGKYKIGLYSDGVVLAAMLDAGLCDYAWLSASRSFAGSKEFYASGRWSLAQDPHVGQAWGGLGVDLDEAKADFGAFRI
jgi:hypothetical protein